MPLISASLIICEKMLQEADGVVSAIRIVDLFTFDTQITTSQEHTGVRFSVIAIAKFDGNDVDAHTGTLRLIRPDGEYKDVQRVYPRLGDLEAKFPGTPRGFNILADVTVQVIQNGTHFLTLLVDEQEVARASFTIAGRIAETATETTE